MMSGTPSARHGRASGHRLTEISDQSTTWTIEHDALGRVTAALDKSYDYDPLGRLVLARDTNDVILESYLWSRPTEVNQSELVQKSVRPMVGPLY